MIFEVAEPLVVSKIVQFCLESWKVFFIFWEGGRSAKEQGEVRYFGWLWKKMEGGSVGNRNKPGGRDKQGFLLNGAVE